MRLTQKEMERLTIFNVAEVARRRWKRGVKLNYVEAIAIICDELLERARDGEETLAELIDVGSRIITEEDVMGGTATMVPQVQLEVMLRDGNKLISIHEPIRLEKRNEGISFDDLVSMV